MGFDHKNEHIDSRMVKMEVNLDDMTGEKMGYLMDLLFSAGANDVFYTPIYMKKNRPAAMLSVLASKEKLDTLKQLIFQETTTFGIRYSDWTVHRLGREFGKVDTQWGPVTVKAALLNGEITQVSPEYEDCRIIAQKEGIPLKQVYDAVNKLAKDGF